MGVGPLYWDEGVPQLLQQIGITNMQQVSPPIVLSSTVFSVALLRTPLTHGPRVFALYAVWWPWVQRVVHMCN